MKYADVVLAILVVGQLLTTTVLVAIGTTTHVAVGVGSLVAIAVIVHALLLNPPGSGR